MQRPEARLRIEALDLAAALGPQGARDVLLRGALDPSDAVRAEAIEHMGGEPQYASTFVDVLTGPARGPQARAAAAEALQELGGELAERYRDAVAQAIRAADDAGDGP